jgi:hypothetical protein
MKNIGLGLIPRGGSCSESLTVLDFVQRCNEDYLLNTMSRRKTVDRSSQLSSYMRCLRQIHSFSFFYGSSLASYQGAP